MSFLTNPLSRICLDCGAGFTGARCPECRKATLDRVMAKAAARYHEDGPGEPEPAAEASPVTEPAQPVVVEPIELNPDASCRDSRSRGHCTMTPPASGQFCLTCGAAWPLTIPCQLDEKYCDFAVAPSDVAGWIQVDRELEQTPRMRHVKRLMEAREG